MGKELSTKRQKNSSNKKFWHTHVDAYEKSGLSRAEYCRQHDLSHHALRYWQKKDAKPGSAANMTLVPVPLERVIQNGTVREWRSTLRLEVGNRFRIEVADEFSPVVLTRLIATLEGC